VSLKEKPEEAMTFDLEDDFENERWRLLALVDRRKNLSDGSEGAIKTDLEIVAARELVRAYETLKGYWSQKAPHRGHKDGRYFPSLSAASLARDPEAPTPVPGNIEDQSVSHSQRLD
jgi:hypothetical protein